VSPSSRNFIGEAKRRRRSPVPAAVRRRLKERSLSSAPYSGEGAPLLAVAVRPDLREAEGGPAVCRPQASFLARSLFLARRKGRIAVIKDLLSLVKGKMKGSQKALGEVLYGMMLHEMDLEMKKERGHLDNLFMLVIFGDLIGLPLLPPYYAMRLLPYIVPSLETWKRRVLREKDLTDFVAHDL